MNISQIKQKYTCIDFLERQGVKLQRGASGYTCRCPWREDKHPSMSITPNGHGWIDHASREKGDLIDLVAKYIGTMDMSKVISHIEQVMAVPFSSNQAESSCGVEGEGFLSFEVAPIRSRKLVEYLWSRGVSEGAAQAAGVLQAYYRLPTSEEGRPPLFALAFPNDAGGYELRSGFFKGSKSPKDISTHLTRENAPVVIYEGFFDLLSFIELETMEKKAMNLNWLVLNSVTNVEKAIEKLSSFRNKIYCLLDNDQAGSLATEKLLQALPTAIDIRHRIAPWNDVNEYLKKHFKNENHHF